MNGVVSDEDFARLRLIRSANIGPVSYAQLIRRFGSAAEALRALPDLARRGGARAPKIAPEGAIESEIAAVHRAHADFLFLDYDRYPFLLRQLSDAPPVLIYRGDLALLDRPAVAMVGARNASAAACGLARKLAQDIGAREFIVVSGLARGIDTAAHQGSLKLGTVGVIAGGIDIYYPPENQDLQEEIAENGLLLSEQPPGTKPTARHFPHRNRIIAGLAAGTLVIEAAPRSGSLITARLAGENGREVMAIPGSPLDPRAAGCNELIRNGAILIRDAADVEELLAPFDGAVEAQSRFNLSDNLDFDFAAAADPVAISDDARQRLKSLLAMTPVAVDDLFRAAEIDAGEGQMILLELELAGSLHRHAGAKVSLHPPAN